MFYLRGSAPRPVQLATPAQTVIEFWGCSLGACMPPPVPLLVFQLDVFCWDPGGRRGQGPQNMTLFVLQKDPSR